MNPTKKFIDFATDLLETYCRHIFLNFVTLTYYFVEEERSGTKYLVYFYG
jgi:hypothetical protein